MKSSAYQSGDPVAVRWQRPASQALNVSRISRLVRRSAAIWASMRVSTCSEPPTLRGARCRARAVGGERVDDLPDRQAELLELPSQADPVEVVIIEGAVPACRAGCRLQDAAALVEADCVDGDARGFGELPDAHAGAGHRTRRRGALTLDHGPEFTVFGMTKLLSIAAQPDAPIACDMTRR